jgi:hypothetical protein
MTLEQAIEHAAEHLPERWQARITVENGSVYVEAVRPDFSEVGMDGAEYDLVDQVLFVVRLARDEIAAEKLSEANRELSQPPSVDNTNPQHES